MAALGREAAAAFSQEFNNATRSALGQSGRGFSDAGSQGAQLFGDAFTAALAGRYYPTALRSVRADAVQGLDAPVVLSWHPLSGADEPDSFYCDTGRTCVMLTRHTVATALSRETA